MRLLKHRTEAEVGNGIFEVGIEPLEGSHVRVGDVFHREGNPFFSLAKWSHRMPELISIENDEIAWLCDQLQMLGDFTGSSLNSSQTSLHCVDLSTSPIRMV